MNSETYIQNAIRTESVPTELNMSATGLTVILQLGQLAAEIMDLAKKKVFYGKDMDITALSHKLNLLAAGATMMQGVLGEGIDLNDKAVDDEMNKDDPDAYVTHPVNLRLLHCAMGCFTESGELVEAAIKQLHTGNIDLVNFGEEIGDIEWYQAIGYHETGVSEAHCREKNIAKLKQRYPEKFESHQAVNRDLAAERVILEGKKD